MIMQYATNEGYNLSSITSTQLCRRFTLAEIRSATNNFYDEMIIGEGGFGKVYKCRIYIEETNQEVAIKRLDYMSNQGASEFRAEIEMLSKLRHCNLVSLIGFCDDNKEMILVYEYIPLGTLHNHLHKVVEPLNWIQRLKIAIGVARGLDYLHTGYGRRQGVVHRDVKSSNILLDENLAAMICDFGLSKISPTNQSISYVEASAKGTFGYLDPEYFYTRKLTMKTDVYAFGVVLFELLSGRLPVDISYGEEQCSLVGWAQKCVKERKFDEMVDYKITKTIFPKCLRRFAEIADQCVHKIPKERSTMTEVVVSLQALLKLQEKYAGSAVSSSIIGMTSRMHKYFNISPKLNFDHVGTSKSSRDNTLIRDADGGQEPVEIDPVFDRVPLSPIRRSISSNINSTEPVHLTLRQVARATRNFSPSLRLGIGGSGTVYKAQLQTGQMVAIKRAKKEHYKGLRSEFTTEIELLENLEHQNLVKLLGFVDKGNERMFITEYVPNGTLREHLDGVHGYFLNFDQRLKICVDIAHALTYLHLYAEKQIIHRDVKSSNILLKETLTAKLGGFGFAILGDAKTDNIPVVTKIRGTVGYLDPEYMRTSQLTPKSDVYSFGILLIEILTGRRPIQSRASPKEKIMTVRWAFGKYDEGHVVDLVDSQMKGSVNDDIFAKMLSLAFQCAAPTRVDRPEMKAVGEQLAVLRMEYLKGNTILKDEMVKLN